MDLRGAAASDLRGAAALDWRGAVASDLRGAAALDVKVKDAATGPGSAAGADLDPGEGVPPRMFLAAGREAADGKEGELGLGFVGVSRN